MTLKRIGNFRCTLALIVIGTIMACSINTASVASPLETIRFVKGQVQGQRQQVASAIFDSDRNGPKSKSKSTDNRGASQRTDQRRQAAESKRRNDQQRQAAESKRRSDQRRQAAESKRRSDQQRQAAESKRRSDQRRQAAESKRRSDQRRQAAESKRRSDQQRQAAESRRRSDQQRRSTEARRQADNAKRSADIKRNSTIRRTPQRNRSSGNDKPSISSSSRSSRSSRSPRFSREDSGKSSSSSRFSRYPRLSQEYNKNNSDSPDRSRLSRTGKSQRSSITPRSVPRISFWRKSTGDDGSDFNERNQQGNRRNNYNKNKSQRLSDLRSRFVSPGASDVLYDPPNSPVDRVIYNYDYNNRYNNYNINTYNNYNNYNNYQSNHYYDYGYDQITCYGSHHVCHSYCWHNYSHHHHDSYGHSLRLWFYFHFHSRHGHFLSYYPYPIYTDYYYNESYYPSYSYPAVYYEPATQITYEPILPSIDEAWALLANGAFEEALGKFAEFVYALPSEAAPRIGYAIASGMLYRNGAAISAMRRAMLDDPQALLDVPVEPLITEHYQWLLEQYADRVREDSQDIDGLFMVAAMRFILEEPADAYFAIDLAIRRGDEDQSAENLKALISDVIEQGF